MSDSTVYAPSADFARSANVQGMDAYRDLYRRAAEDPEKFWGELAEHELHWFTKWSKVLDWNPPFAKWFVGGKTNISYNCLDRHVSGTRRDKVAILWQGEPGDERRVTYAELHRMVCRFANVLKSLGYKTGDRS